MTIYIVQGLSTEWEDAIKKAFYKKEDAEEFKIELEKTINIYEIQRYFITETELV